MGHAATATKPLERNRLTEATEVTEGARPSHADQTRSWSTPGQLQWVRQNEDEAFRYVMYTLRPFVFDRRAEQDLINGFYATALTNTNYGFGKLLRQHCASFRTKRKRR